MPIHPPFPATLLLAITAWGCGPQRHDCSQLLAPTAADRFEARSAQLTASFDADGMQVAHRGSRLSITPTAWGHRGQSSDLGPASPRFGACIGDPHPSCPRWIERDHHGIVERWRVGADELEQRFEIATRPAGSGPLGVHLAIEGATPTVTDDDSTSAWLLDSAGTLWRYAGLAAWDATGRPLHARMTATEHGLTLWVDADRARYPVLIDPVLTPQATKLTASDGGDEDYFGGDLSAAGDVNGDGYDDVLVGASGYDGAFADQGAMYFYPGGSTGVSASLEVSVRPSDALEGQAFGHSVDGAGDVNGDGYDDVVTGARFDDHVATNAGAAYFYAGGASGPRSDSEQKILLPSGAINDTFGFDVGGAGDVDGDGYDDFLVGCHLHNTRGLSDAGAAYLYYGSSTGPDAGAVLELSASDAAAGEYYGYSVTGGGDVDGDGYDDVAIGARYDNTAASEAGAAYLYYGASTGLDSATEQEVHASDADHEDHFGRPVAHAGDVNGDGWADLVVGAKDDDDGGAGTGSAYVYLGATTGLDPGSEQKLTASDPRTKDYFGASVDGAGDVDGDGYDDVLIGASEHDELALDAGAAYVYHGSTTGVDVTREQEIHASDGEEGDKLGALVAGLGDVNGDGLGDLMVGAFYDDDQGTDAGAVYIFHGCTEATWYLDADGDGWGAEGDALDSCDTQPGRVLEAGDCDDDDGGIHPDASDSCGDGVDSDCDGSGGPGSDEDGDGVLAEDEAALGLDDCDDDVDDDGLSDGEELVLGTDPLLADSDGDGLNDGDEVVAGTDPTDADDPRPPEDTGEPPPPDDTDQEPPPEDCSCASAPGSGALLPWLALGLAAQRRRRP